MGSLRRAALYGVVVWLVPFAAAFLVFPIRESNRPLFESIMPVTVAAVVTALGLIHFRRLERPSAGAGPALGLLWLTISVVIDAPLMLLGGPMRMTVGQYVSDIGITYLLIPVITTGIALARVPPGPASGT